METITADEARKQKLKRYFTGKQCKHGHIVERFTGNHNCVECDRLKRLQSKKPRNKYNKQYYIDNKIKYQEYYENNTERYKVNEQNHRAKNPGRINAYCAKRRATKLLATPNWSETTQIEELFNEALEITKSSKVLHHVDHIFPLISDKVCGLHVIANLQIITATENLKKKCQFTEDDL